MIDNTEALEVLFGKVNALWRAETRHEAMLLMRALYKADFEAREKISSAILAGPPSQFLRDEPDDETDWRVFEMLAFLESEDLPLLPAAQRKLADIRERQPEWKSSKFPGMSMYVESDIIDKSVSPNDINSIVPEDIPKRVITFDEQQSLRHLCEAIGVRLGHDPEWGLRALDAMEVNIQNLPLNAINPILWGIRATVTDSSIKLSNDDVRALLNKFGSMVKKRPTPSIWSSLPSLLRSLIGKFALPIEHWDELAIQLALLFEAFDFERSDEKQPIDWRHRAINHPYGDIAELYLSLAQQYVNVLSGAGKPLGLEPHAEKFFSQMLAHYSLGSRYGLCLLAPWLSWIEAISATFADSLYPDFEWGREGERPFIAWSGYLWSNTLSRRLVQNFSSTYLAAAKCHSEFGSQERRALASHVSAVFWFHPSRPELLYQFAGMVDSELRVALLRGWKRHLENAQEENAKAFFDIIVFPYWDWCARQDFFRDGTGDKERFAFWELVPLSFASFPEACRRAVQSRPSKVTHIGLFVRDALNSSTLRYPDELTELLIALLAFDPYPGWQEADFRKSWLALKNAGAKYLVDLENALARKGIAV